MAKIFSAAITGVEAQLITVEADVAQGLPSFTIVGLPDLAVREARDRIRSAIRNSGYPFPRTKVTVNLAPADIKKQGAGFDLPIAMAILDAQGVLPQRSTNDNFFLGELSLGGEIRAVSGVLPCVMAAMKRAGMEIFVPKDNADEAASVQEANIFAPGSLSANVEHLIGSNQLTRTIFVEKSEIERKFEFDMADIKGQEMAKRGLEIAAAGAHNVLLKGPPGTGKTLLARALPSILPSLTYTESLEVTAIASVAQILTGQSLIKTRPFRAPHHSTSAVALIGGGTQPRPGEVTLAHRGVLFLDELAEFSQHTLEHLRQPMEDGFVNVTRAAAAVRFPSRFLFIAATNPCPCGFASDPKRECTCAPRALTNYRKKISGPLLDRFDLVVEVPNLATDKLLTEGGRESSETVRERVLAARERQQKRFTNTSWLTNAEIAPGKLNEWCKIDEAGKELIKKAVQNHNLSARGLARVRKVARTIADLEGVEEISAAHLAEALQYRLQEWLR